MKQVKKLMQVYDEGALCTNVGALIECLQQGKPVDTAIIRPVAENKISSRLPEHLLENVKLFKVMLLINNKWKPIAMVYEKYFAELMGAALYSFTKLSIKVVSHPDNVHVLSFNKERERFLKWAKGVARTNAKLEKEEEHRKSLVEQLRKKKKAPTKVMMRKHAVKVVPTGVNGRILKDDYAKAILKMNPEANVDKNMRQMKTLYTRTYNQCALAPTDERRPAAPRKSAPKKAPKKILRKLPKKLPKKRITLKRKK